MNNWLLKTFFSPENIRKNILALFGFFSFMLSWELLNSRDAKLWHLVLLCVSSACVAVFFSLYSRKEAEYDYTFILGDKNILFTVFIIAGTILSTAAGTMLLDPKFGVLPFVFYGIAIFLLFQVYDIKEVKAEKVPFAPAKAGKDNYLPLKFILVLVMSLACLYYFSVYMLAPVILLVFAIALLIGDFFNGTSFDTVEKMTKHEYYILALIMLVAVFLRFFMFEGLPPGYNNDTRRTLDLLNYLASGKDVGVYLNIYDINAASLDLYIIYAITRVIGASLFNLRLIEVTFSIIAIPFFFLLVREMYGKRTAIFSTIFFSALFICVNYSRYDIAVYRVCLYLIAGLYFLLRGIKTGSKAMFAVTGLLTAVGLYGYHAGKMQVIIITAAYLLYGINILKLKSNYRNIINLVFIGVVALIVFMPLLNYIVFNYNAYFYYSSGFKLKASGMDFVLQILDRFKDIAFAFTVKGPDKFPLTLPSRPFLTGVECLLFVTGISCMLAGIGKKNNLLMAVWLAAGMAPLLMFQYVFKLYLNRMILVFPALCIILGLGANTIFSYLNAMIKGRRQVIFAALAAVFLVYTGTATYVDYFIKFAHNSEVKDRYHNVNYTIEKLVKEKAKHSTVFISGFYLRTYESLFFCMECSDKNGAMYSYADVSMLKFSDLYKSKKDILIIAEGFYSDYFDYLKDFFPNVKIDKVKNPDKETKYVDPYAQEYLYIAVEIPRADIEKACGLKAQYYKGNVLTREETVKSVIDTAGSDKIVLSGSIELPENTRYELSFKGAARASLYMDGKRYAGAKLSKGLHEINAVLEGLNAGPVKMFWKYNGGESEIPASCLLQAAFPYGLDITYSYYKDARENFSMRGPGLNTRIYVFDPRMKFESETNQYTIIWDGFYDAKNDGVYCFDFESCRNFCNAVNVDGKQVSFSNLNASGRKNFYMKKGLHQLHVITYSYAFVPDAALFYYRLNVRAPGDKAFRPVDYRELRPYE